MHRSHVNEENTEHHVFFIIIVSFNFFLQVIILSDCIIYILMFTSTGFLLVLTASS